MTQTELRYDGSCAIDSVLLDQAGIQDYEQIQIYNLSNGARFTTYAIRAGAGSRVVSVNGAAARLSYPGDRLIVCAYATLERQEARGFKPKLLYLDEDNRIRSVRDHIPIQAV